MKVILNIAGLVMVIIAGLILSGMNAITDSSSMAGAVAGITTVLMDVIYRVKKDENQSINWTKFIRPFRGGHVFYVPVWIWGIIIVIAGLAS